MSSAIFEEYQAVLDRPKFKGLNPKEVSAFLGRLKEDALWVMPDIAIDVIKNDPADNKFLECALADKAHAIITGNQKHFPFKKFKSTSILSPGEFILEVAKDVFDRGTCGTPIK